MKWHTAKDDEEVVIQEDQDGDLGLSQQAYIRNGTHFEVESQPETYYDDPRNPTTGVLGMSNRTNHDY